MNLNFRKTATALLIPTLMIACTTPQMVTPIPAPSPSVIASPIPTPSPSPREVVVDKTIFDACAKHVWKNRGVAPMNYFQEIAVSYHSAFCSKQNFPNKDIDHDALLYFGLPQDLISTYTLLIGLGLRESTGDFCAGRDTSASNTDSMTAEAGAFQSSYNSMGADPKLREIFTFYRQNNGACGQTKPNCSTQNYGTGDGLDFQKLSKECPQFAILYNAYLIRVLRRHFGPLIRREAEFLPECRAMLKEVEKSGC